MKKLLFASCILFTMLACKSNQEPQEVAVSFNVSNLQVTTAAMGPHKVGSLTDAKITDLWVMVDGVVKIHQVSTDDGFGSFTLSLKYGVQTIDFIGGTREGQSVSDGVWSCDKVDNTYAETMELDVNPTTPAQVVTLRHLDYCIAWESTDKLPESVVKVELGVKEWHGSLGEGLIPGEAVEKTIVIDNVSSRYGKTLPVFMGGFCSVPWGDSDENVTATFVAYDKDGGEVCSFEKVVPVRSNRKTTISGRMFGYNETATLSVSTAYNEERQMPL